MAQILGITPEELVRRHTGNDFCVAFVGFAGLCLPVGRA